MTFIIDHRVLKLMIGLDTSLVSQVMVYHHTLNLLGLQVIKCRYIIYKINFYQVWIVIITTTEKFSMFVQTINSRSLLVQARKCKSTWPVLWKNSQLMGHKD